MPRDLFGDVTRPSISIGNRKWYTVPVSLFSHAAIVIAIVAIPMLAPGLMPEVLTSSLEVPIIKVIPPPPPPPKIRPAEKIEPAADINAAPIDAPEGITPEKPVIEAGWEDSQPGVGVVDGLFDATAIVAPPPPPQQPVPIGGKIRRPEKTRDVQPAYPPMAQAARVEGIVIIEATIGADGRV